MKLTKKIFENKKTIISGIQASGKTFLAKELLKNFKAVVFTLNKDDVKNYFITKKNLLIIDDKDIIKNFEYWLKKCKEWSEENKIDCIFIDDADVFFKNHMDTNATLRDIWSNHRHYKLTLFLVSHRLQDIPARLYGQVENFILFTIESPHTKDLLNKFYPNLGNVVCSLPFKSYKFVLKIIGQPPKILKYSIKRKSNKTLKGGIKNNE